MMVYQMSMLRQGHLEAVLHVFAFLCQNQNSRMMFDPTYPAINMSEFKECVWKDFYGELKEAIPSNSPQEKGKEVDLREYVDINHAGENKTRRSRSGFYLF